MVCLFVSGCTTIPGANYPKEASTALGQPEATKLGRQVYTLAGKHPGSSGLRLLPSGIEGLQMRLELANAAERTVDLQYFTIQNDTTGKLLMSALVRAADRGVRVRMLIDDSDDIARDRQITALAAHPRIDIRIFNPFYTRGMLDLLRYVEFAVAGQRLNYRMHNKLFVVDNAAAIVGGRNVGDEYFQASSATNFGDFDVLAIGSVAKQLSSRFDEFWNSDLAIPVQALLLSKPSDEGLRQYRAELEQNLSTMQGSEYMQKLAKTPPFAKFIGRDNSLAWAKVEVLSDSPEKGKVEDGEVQGTLLRRRLGQAIRDVKSELDVVSPYLVPGDGGMRLLEQLRARGVRVRVLTNSLASTDMPIVHAGYKHYRTRMLEDDIELYEVRPLPGRPEKGGGSLTSPSSGQFALHAKVFVLDQRYLFIGSMNFDRRSLRLNTEIGLLIDSPELARQVTARFNEIAQPANCYVVALGPADGIGRRPVTWRTEEQGKTIESTTEPTNDALRGIKTDFLTLLPIDDLL